jgi:hypothetical protein
MFGLLLRNNLVPRNPVTVNNSWMHMLFFPFSQMILSLAIYEESKLRSHSFEQILSKTCAGSNNSKNDTLHVDDLLTFQICNHIDRKRPTRITCPELLQQLLPKIIILRSTSQNWKRFEWYLAYFRLSNADPTLRNLDGIAFDWWHGSAGNVSCRAWPFIQQAMIAYPSVRMSPKIQPSKQFVMDFLHRGGIT